MTSSCITHPTLSRQRLILEDEDLPLEMPASMRAPYTSPDLPPTRRPAAPAQPVANVTREAGTIMSTAASTGAAAAATVFPDENSQVNAARPASNGTVHVSHVYANTARSGDIEEAMRQAGVQSSSQLSSGAIATPAPVTSESCMSHAVGASDSGLTLQIDQARRFASGGDKENSCRDEGEIEDLMAQVAHLEEQGRLVEASSLMASLVLQQGGGGQHQ